MKNERILNILGQVDEKYILEATPGKQKKVRKGNWAKWGVWGAMAACACLVFFVGTRIVFFGGTDAAETANDMSAGASDNGYGYKESAKQETAMEGAPAEAPETLASGSAASVTEEETASSEAMMAEPKEEVKINWGVTLTVENVTPTGLTLVCTQSGGEITGELQTGSDYRLMVLEDGNWEYVPYIVEEIAWTEEAYLIPMEGSVQWEINWEGIYGQLPTGTYRITKNIMDFRGTGDYDTASCYAEFMIADE